MLANCHLVFLVGFFFLNYEIASVVFVLEEGLGVLCVCVRER